MKRVAILTDFINFDPAYSLCRVARDQIRSLQAVGYSPALLVRKSSQQYGVPEIEIDHGRMVNNTVRVTEESELEIQSIHDQLRKELKDIDVVLTHDLIYQPNMWKCHVAARRLAKERPDLKWLHWVHSISKMDTGDRTGYKELKGPFPNSKLIAMHLAEVEYKSRLYGYESPIVIPNPLDFVSDLHQVAREMIDRADLLAADVIAVYPLRLDRGKQPEIVIEILSHIDNSRVVICDFHSMDGDKAKYREELRRPGVYFTSDIPGSSDGLPHAYCVPHRAIMDLLEVGDMLIHPSKAESDPLILQEAMWKRCGLVLNYDLPMFRLYEGGAIMGKFSSNVVGDEPGSTNTCYHDRNGYMKDIAGKVVRAMQSPVLSNHVKVRKTRNVKAVGKLLWAAIEG